MEKVKVKIIHDGEVIDLEGEGVIFAVIDKGDTSVGINGSFSNVELAELYLKIADSIITTVEDGPQKGDFKDLLMYKMFEDVIKEAQSECDNDCENCNVFDKK